MNAAYVLVCLTVRRASKLVWTRSWCPRPSVGVYQMAKRNPNIWESIDFIPSQRRILKAVSKNLLITIPGAVESVLEFGLVPFYCIVAFFKEPIETNPGSRLSHEDIWSAFQEWWQSYGFTWHINADQFDVMGHAICLYKKIALRVRGNQVFCSNVRLRE